MTVKVIAFDFDGVIVNSLKECYIVCKKVLEQMGEKAEKLSWEEFKRGRSFVLSSEDFYPVIKAIMENVDFSEISQEDFEKLKHKNRHKIREFAEKFHKIREEMIDEDSEKWKRLNIVYPNIVEAIKSISKRYKVVIATAKDRKSTFLLLRSAGLNFKEKDVITREFSIKKTEQIKRILEKFRLGKSDLLFVEDMFENAKSVMGMGVKVALVGWGYYSKKQKEGTRKFGIPIIRNHSIVRDIGKLLSS